MTDTEPSQSQQVNHHPQLFVDSGGQPIPIFVDPGGILGRPQLVRTLQVRASLAIAMMELITFQRHGASVCSDPKAARFLLVDADTRTGRQFIRDWGQDNTRRVLKSTWVKEAIKASRLLEESDGWGGCATYDDGLPIDEEDNTK